MSQYSCGLINQWWWEISDRRRSNTSDCPGCVLSFCLYPDSPHVSHLCLQPIAHAKLALLDSLGLKRCCWDCTADSVHSSALLLQTLLKLTPVFPIWLFSVFYGPGRWPLTPVLSLMHSEGPHYCLLVSFGTTQINRTFSAVFAIHGSEKQTLLSSISSSLL